MVAKVMVLIASQNISGPVKGVFQFIENMGRSDIVFRLYNFQVGDKAESRFSDHVQSSEIKVHYLTQEGHSYISLVRQVIKELKNNNCNLIQTHGFKPTFLAFCVKLICNVRWICFMHGTTRENVKVAFYNLVDNICQRFADLTVVVSENQRQKVWGGRNETRVRVLHNAVDIDNPMPMSENPLIVADKLKMPAGAQVVLAVGRLSPEKGMDVLLDAFSHLVQLQGSVHLLLVGDGPERSALEKQVLLLKLEGIVHFVGYTATPGDYVKVANVLVLPSRSEGIPNVILEAMAMQLPVVATKVGGVPEIIDDGINGLIVAPEDPNELAKAINVVLSDDDLKKQFILAGSKRVKEAFGIQTRVNRLQGFYREVLKEITM